MNHQEQLKLQAWLDGELGPADVRDVARRVARDPEAAALARELKLTRQWLAAGEVPRTVPEPREFYWAQIARRLEPRAPLAPSPAPAGPVLRRWLGWLIPATAAGLLAAGWLVPRLAPAQRVAVQPAEIETPTDEIGTITFRSESEQMTVVWINSY